MLNNPSERNQAVGKDAKAQWIDQQVKSLAGSSENADAIYALAADIMENVAEEANGDPEAMLKALEKAKSNPEAFAAKLSPNQREKLRSIAGQLQPWNSASGLK